VEEKLVDINLHQDTTGFTLSLWFDDEFMPKIDIAEILGVNMPFGDEYVHFIGEVIRRNMVACVDGGKPKVMDVKYVNSQRAFTINVDGKKVGGYILN